MSNPRILPWEEFEKLSLNLASKISTEKYDSLICVSTGGLPIGTILHDQLNLPLSIISAESYVRGETKQKSLKVGSIASTFPLEGRVLLVDDLVDKGKTLEVISAYLKEKFPIKILHTAVLYKKPTTEFEPDYFVETTSDWIIFPYQIKEFENLKK